MPGSFKKLQEIILKNDATDHTFIIEDSQAKIRAYTNSLSETVFSVKPLFKRFKRFEKSLYGLKRPIFESELVLPLYLLTNSVSGRSSDDGNDSKSLTQKEFKITKQLLF